MTGLWGPFMQRDLPYSEDIQVDWERVEALMFILAWNMEESCKCQMENKGIWNLLPHSWAGPFVGVTPNSFEAPSRSLSGRLDFVPKPQDPYNITGTWMRVICFLDYNEFHEFNFSCDPLGSGYARPPLKAVEETMYIVMELQVHFIEPLQPQENLPVVRVKGSAFLAKPQSGLNSRSRVNGASFES